MQCPYCVSAIDDAALVCPHCTRDLYLFKPLHEKIKGLEEKLAAQPDPAALQARIEALEAELAEKSAPPPAPSIVGSVGTILTFWLTPLALLLLAHFMMTVAYDINTLYLRIVSLLVPLPFGLLLMRTRAHPFGLWLGGAFLLAVLAVLGMSAVIGMIDKTPILPADLREWREFFEYAASIGFSYATGMLLGRMMSGHRSKTGLAMRLAKAASQGQDSAEKMQMVAKKLNEVGGTLTATVTTVISIYTGLKGFFGDS